VRRSGLEIPPRRNPDDRDAHRSAGPDRIATLTALELLLGIDTIFFISILVDKLPPERREVVRRIGLSMAMLMRIGLPLRLAWIVGLVEPLFTVLGQAISGRDLILISPPSAWSTTCA